MIIEIKDLPEGRKVSRISVDITFEDSDDSSKVDCYDPIKQTDSVTKSNPGVVSVIEPNESISTDNTDNDAPQDTQIKDNFEDRKPKEIPTEMLDLEL